MVLDMKRCRAAIVYDFFYSELQEDTEATRVNQHPNGRPGQRLFKAGGHKAGH
jgi:hypothetical protein